MPANKSDMNRRAFLKESAFTGVVASRIIKYPKISSLVSPQENTEGVITERWITTSCLNCFTWKGDREYGSNQRNILEYSVW